MNAIASMVAVVPPPDAEQCAVFVTAASHTAPCGRVGARPLSTVCSRGHTATVNACDTHHRVAASGRGWCEVCNRNGYTSPLTVAGVPG